MFKKLIGHFFDFRSHTREPDPRILGKSQKLRDLEEIEGFESNPATFAIFPKSEGLAQKK